MIYKMPVSEIEQRTAKLIQVRESILDSQTKLEGYAERIDELLDWAEQESEELARHIALHKMDRALKRDKARSKK